MEVISQILKLKKQSVENSLADFAKQQVALDKDILKLEKDRDKGRRAAIQIAKSNSQLSGVDLQIAQKWCDQLTRRLVFLDEKRSALQAKCENLKSELRELLGKVELSERQIKVSQRKIQNEHVAAAGERRLENWRLSNLNKD
ncbi:MAG: hypothetical protein EX271_10770 [Acidimicrobiales bacterium]|nr:hypothetical protein [Hyphomonadaceae bacterium]RZV39175.1 MAG: hypothetical protein EX271_10770 [Acidimicrobiales bacterium]